MIKTKLSGAYISKPFYGHAHDCDFGYVGNVGEGGGIWVLK